jgi:hypothetical protein
MELIKIVRAKYIEDYKIEFQFNNGIIKIIDLSSEIYGEVFEPLRDVEYFKNFSLNPFTIEWENGADFAPEHLFRMVNLI